MVGFIYWGYKFFRSYSYSNNSAMKILSEKYTLGEISEEEYLKRKKVYLNRKVIKNILENQGYFLNLNSNFEIFHHRI